MHRANVLILLLTAALVAVPPGLFALMTAFFGLFGPT